MSMRIVDGVGYERKRGNFYRVKFTCLDNGHVEAVASQGWEWHEVCVTPEALALFQAHNAELLSDPDFLAERAQRHAERAARRARQRVRLLCKSMGADTLITLTYRDNVTDLDLCKRHLKEFVRRVKRVLPGFRAVCAFEQQKRGAWHVHMATERLVPVAAYQGAFMRSYDLLRAIWRSVTKAAGGNVDVQARKRHSRRSPARIAAYLSKYLGKAFTDGPSHSNRWTKFGDISEPESIQLGHMLDLREAICLMYDLLPQGSRIVTSYLSRWQDVFFLVGEPPPAVTS
ncbi:rolling circle replication-associated protein [Vandammella animalimorsus]|nr:hypothetical protein [Vandammella animalimorsus]